MILPTMTSLISLDIKGVFGSAVDFEKSTVNCEL
jgi:hypothetical protein